MSVSAAFTTADHGDLAAQGVSAATAPEPLGKARIAAYVRATWWEQKHLPARVCCEHPDRGDHYRRDYRDRGVRVHCGAGIPVRNGHDRDVASRPLLTPVAAGV
ncbi:hypothetical protein [Rhodococcus jostii]|uniref:hypothetical protein n=1 Tax=Rhodococcus jostii TaxID=132919 RepID=UPI003628BC85